jgi:5-methylcytosine-specific restriction endonuclease McrA
VAKDISNKNAKVRGEFIEHVRRDEVYKRAQGRCGLCGQHVAKNAFEIDHIVPASKGGHHAYYNVQPAHPHCNRAKADMMPWEYQELLRAQRLSQPKRTYKKRKQRYRNVKKWLGR